MKVNPLPEDTDVSLALAETVAAILAEKHYELGISTEVEVLLRASIAAATFAINSYLFALARASKSPLTVSYLSAAKAQCNRKIKLLRRRINRSIAHLCRFMGEPVVL